MSVLMSESFIHSFIQPIHSNGWFIQTRVNWLSLWIGHWIIDSLDSFVYSFQLIIEILLYCFFSIAVCIYTFLWVTLCVLSLSHTHSHSLLAQHKYLISRCLHWMPLKLESFSRETMYLHVTVSVRMAVTSLPAPLTIKRSAQNGKMWDWPAGHRSGPVMRKIIRFRSLAGQSVHLYCFHMQLLTTTFLFTIILRQW